MRVHDLTPSRIGWRRRQFWLAAIALLVLLCLKFSTFLEVADEDNDLHNVLNDVVVDEVETLAATRAAAPSSRSGPSWMPQFGGCREASLTTPGGSCVRGSVVLPQYFGARGDGDRDDTKAVVAALNYAARCPGVVVHFGPSSRRFLVMPGMIRVENLCNVSLQFHGFIVGPPMLVWNPKRLLWPRGACAYGELNCLSAIHPEYERTRWSLLHLRYAYNVTLHGPGGLKAPGHTFWPQRHQNAQLRAYMLLKLDDSIRVTINGIVLRNSPLYHLALMHCRGIDVRNVRVLLDDFKPQLSSKQHGKNLVGKWGPQNTDGISVFACTHVTIQDCELHSGDDNVVIKEASWNIRVWNLVLRYGKGVSIGSLGETIGRESLVVGDVHFRNVSLIGCRHGVRIKTWRGGVGSVINSSFQDFQMSGGKIGVFIDQTYCPASQRPEGCSDSKEAVLIKGLFFRRFSGILTAKPCFPTEVRCSNCIDVKFDDFENLLVADKV